MRLEDFLPPAITSFLKAEGGTSFSEYALVAVLIAVVCIIAVLALRKFG